MMAIDQRQIDFAISMRPTREQSDAIDRAQAECARIAKMRAATAVRAGDDSPWLVLRVMTGREIAVRDALTVADVEVVVPMKLGPKLRRFHKEIPPKLQPVMVGYILVRCRLINEALAGLLTFDHVVGVLGGYEKPYLVEATHVNDFNEKADKGEFNHEVPQSVFVGVKRVAIRDGIFAGRTAELVSGGVKGKGVAVVELMLFGQATPMIMPLAFLSPL
ncbi:antitermination protein NusG [Brucella anthropi]|uniref:transcription termination/antitermination NusG family protein n=1 Tax=Brucella/Ochrobactrum group TaxID=2826938 RepID=UPI00124D8A86|nr:MULTISPECIES: transcription termination/antitermination NusG family protein [Brucella/Ochrobactrum group]KAB2764776.1 antitermination protein NusG [Brucella anthropi]KAB2782553.1 antitermination protein NusG [Brucella anthropi]MCQ9143321.1 antitermination protein NusG [Ochrobactrum sp. BTU2]UGQ23856.1 antitermination protein NusG [Brucella anthropi]